MPINVGNTSTSTCMRQPDRHETIKAEVDGFLALEQTAATEKGRKVIRSMAFRLARTRTALEGVGKALADEVKVIPKKVDATRKRIRDTLEKWEEHVRRPLTEWEEAEKARVDAHERELDSIFEHPEWGMDETAADIQRRLDYLRNYPARDWQEFAERAADAIAAEIERTERLFTAAEKREAEAAELAKLRAEAAARAAREREEQAAREADERERQIAEQAVAAERARAERAARAEREKAEAEGRAKLAAEKAERDRIAAAEAAAENERRLAAEQRAREEREAAAREANKAHRAKINNAAKAGLVASGLSEQAAVTAVTAIVRGDVPNCRISY